MNPSINSRGAAGAPDETRRARERIELGITVDSRAHSATLARLIAASVHGGAGTALEHFAATGHLSADAALRELSDVRVPIERESWVDALGQHIVNTERAEPSSQAERRQEVPPSAR